MGKYGLKIKIFQAGSIYEVDLGVRKNYDQKNAMLANSLFLDYLKDNGLSIYKDKATRDVIGIEFNYGSSSYSEAVSKIKQKLKLIEDEEMKANYEKRIEELGKLKDLFEKKSREDIRTHFYENGVTIHYYDETIHYKMLFRTPGKAKKGSCMFIREELYDDAHNFLYMGIELPEKNAPIVEFGAYSSLVTSTIEGRIKIDPSEILVVKDVDAFFTTNVISIETDENKQCRAKELSNYRLKNTMFDGQALIDESIFPEWGDGYILLRHHFTKCATFCTRVQKFFKDYFKEEYETAIVVDMWGNEHLAKDIKLIATDQTFKWIKFDITFDYWADLVRANDCTWGIVKTAHKSKMGDVQRMSYQMVNALSMDTIEEVTNETHEYLMRIKRNDNEFIEFLKRNANFSNDYDVLMALLKFDPDFSRSDYFRGRKKAILMTYVKDIKNGRIIQNADNLVIVGSPYAMLLHSVGADPLSDPTFVQEDGTIQCWTGRFEDGEYLAEFRNPFNSKNNMGYLHNVWHEYFDKYFNLGKLCIAVNMNGTDFQDRNNGLTKWVSVQKCA